MVESSSLFHVRNKIMANHIFGKRVSITHGSSDVIGRVGIIEGKINHHQVIVRLEFPLPDGARCVPVPLAGTTLLSTVSNEQMRVSAIVNKWIGDRDISLVFVDPLACDANMIMSQYRGAIDNTIPDVEASIIKKLNELSPSDGGVVIVYLSHASEPLRFGVI